LNSLNEITSLNVAHIFEYELLSLHVNKYSNNIGCRITFGLELKTSHQNKLSKIITLNKGSTESSVRN
jgi:hypothetical protein